MMPVQILSQMDDKQKADVKEFIESHCVTATMGLQAALVNGKASAADMKFILLVFATTVVACAALVQGESLPATFYEGRAKINDVVEASLKVYGGPN